MFGDGLLCVGTPVARIATRFASDGLAAFPLNHMAGPGEFHYQALYRNAAPAFCTPERFNLTNGFSVAWP